MSAELITKIENIPKKLFDQNETLVVTKKSIGRFMKDKHFRLFVFYVNNNLAGTISVHTNYLKEYYDNNENLKKETVIYLLGAYFLKQFRK